MKNGPLVVVSVVSAALLAGVVILIQENIALRRELAGLRHLAATPKSDGATVVTVQGSETTVSAEAAAATAEEPPAPAAPPPPGAEGEPERRDFGRRERGAEIFARALSDPDARAALLTRMKGEVDRRFGDYFVKLGLNEVQIEALRTLLAERQMARMEAGLLQRTAEDDQARAEAEAWRDAKLASTEAEINGILGEDGLENLQAYLDSAPQRRIVDDIARRANYMGAPLSDDANTRLLAAIQQANTDHPVPALPTPGRGGWNGGGEDFGPINQATVQQYLADRQKQNEQVISQARDFLTQPQLEALADQQIDEMQQVEAQLNFLLRNPDARFGPGGFGGGRGGRGGRGPGG